MTSTSASASLISSDPIVASAVMEEKFNTLVDNSKTSMDTRICLLGAVDSGKSTLIGLLTGGELDDGRGSARSRVFLHRHELSNGKTASISQHICGYDSSGAPVFNSASASAAPAIKTKSWSSVVAASSKILTFIDLCGHEHFLHTTISGLTGSFPDYAMLIVNSLSGVSVMTREHLLVVLSLGIPLICIVTKVDLAPANVLVASKTQLFKVLKSPGADKMPVQIKSDKDVQFCLADESNRVVPVFFVSAVSGLHINLIHSFLAGVKPKRIGIRKAIATTSEEEAKCVEFAVDEIFNVTGVGLVLSGLVLRGTMTANLQLMLGPLGDGSFRQIRIRSVHYKRVAVDSVSAGDTCSMAISSIGRKDVLTRASIRKGMIVADAALCPKPTTFFSARIRLLHHSTSVQPGYSCVLHCGLVRQTAVLISCTDSVMRTGDESVCVFRFLQRPEIIRENAPVIFREGKTKGIGKIIRSQFTDEELHGFIAGEEEFRAAKRRRNWKPKFQEMSNEQFDALTVK